MTITANGISKVDMSLSVAPKSNSKTGSSDFFSSVMDISVAKNEESGVDGVKPVDNRTVDTNTKDKVKDEYDAFDEKTDYSVNKSEKEDNKDDVKSLDSVVNDTDDLQPDDEIVEVVSALQQNIMQMYDISDEELKAVLDEMGIELTDLQDAGVVKELILNLEGVTKVDLLINQELNEKMDSILADISTLTENADIVEMTDAGLDELVDESTVEVEAIASDDEAEVEVDEKSAKRDTLDNVNTAVVDEEAEISSDAFSSESDFGFDNENKSDSKDVLDNLSVAIDNAIETESIDGDMTAQDFNGADIVRQVIDEIKLSASREVKSIEVKLNPESLGNVHITVENKNGVMQTRIVAETEAAQKAIVAGIESLKDAFNTQDLKVDSIEVLLAPHSYFEDGQSDSEYDGERQNNNSSNGISGVSEEVDLDEVEEQEEMIRETMKNTVSYMA